VAGVAVVAALSVGGGGGGRAAALGLGGHRVAAGTISTIAGGTGGPGPGTDVFVGWGNLSYAAGHVYLADGLVAQSMSTRTGWMTALAGTGDRSPLGDGGPAVSAGLEEADGAAADHAGNVVIADSGDEMIRVAAAHSGTYYGRSITEGDIYTVAGDGDEGFSGDGGPATKAALFNPVDAVVDGAGNLVISDADNNRIRVVAERTGTMYGRPMIAGDIYTVAGSSNCGFSGDGGPATKAKLCLPRQVAVDSAGNLLITDEFNNRIRVVAERTGTMYGRPMTEGDIYTVAGDGDEGFSGDGGPATKAALNTPLGVAADRAGNLLIADFGSCRVRVVAEHTGTMYGRPMTAGDIYTVAGSSNCGYSGDGGPATKAGLPSPASVAVDGAGNLVISTTHEIRVVAERTGHYYGRPMTAGDIYTAAGTSGLFPGMGRPAAAAELSDPEGLALDSRGDLLIVQPFAAGVLVVAAASGTLYGQRMTAGDIYRVAGTGVDGFSGDGGPATKAEFDVPHAVAVDHAGNLVVADLDNNRIRMVAARTGRYYGQPMTAGDIYTVAGDGTEGFSGDGGPAAQAELWMPEGAAFDGAGNLLIADFANDRIRVVAARSGRYYGQPMTAGDIYTVAGGGSLSCPSSPNGVPATKVALCAPRDVQTDAAGNLVITSGQQIRVVAEHTGMMYRQPMTEGDIYTVAGDGTEGFSGDGGPATQAELDVPYAATVDSAGNLVIADVGNNRIRMVAEHTGTMYGQPMTAGDIYTVAGDGTEGYSGDGGPATQAELFEAEGVVVTSTGDLLFSDTLNSRIREVTP
jgi:hypothetical protein